MNKTNPPHTFAGMITTTAKRTRQQKNLVRDVVQFFLAEVRRQAWTKGHVVVPGFVAATVRKHKARNIRNPITKKIMRLPSGKAVKLRASKNWRTR